MLNLSPSIRIFVHALPTDMRKHFDGLMAIVTHNFGKDIFQGDYFVFLNRCRNRCKILFWDRDGLVVWAKKLETENTQIFGFTEVGKVAYNRRIGPAEAGRMVGTVRTTSPWRRVMSGQGSPIVPSPCGKRSRSARSTLDAAVLPERQRRALRILAGIVARQLVPLSGKEAGDDCQGS